MPDGILNPAARVLWRTAETVQLELGGRAVVLDGVDHSAVAWLLGQRGDTDDTGEQSRADLSEAIPALNTAGFLLHPTARPARALPTPRLATEWAVLRSRFGDHAHRVLSRRRRTTVEIRGTGRIAAVIGASLAAAGVGGIYFTDADDVRLQQCAPGGLTPDDEGERFSAAAVAAVWRAAPDCDTRPVPPGGRPTLTVLTVDSPVDDDVRTALHMHGRPHLVACTWPESATIGPLVLPGSSSCLRCADLHRQERDPAWPVLAVQLSTPSRHAYGCDVVLATLAAGMTVMQTLAFVDEPAHLPTVVDGTLELRLPDWRVRRRSWPPHPDCDCGAYTDIARRDALRPAE